jgi:hypothetical protein
MSISSIPSSFESLPEETVNPKRDPPCPLVAVQLLFGIKPPEEPK